MMMEGHNNLPKRALQSTFVARTYSTRDLFVCNDCTNQYIKIFLHLRVRWWCGINFYFQFRHNMLSFIFHNVHLSIYHSSLCSAALSARALFLAEKPLENLITRAKRQTSAKEGFVLLSKIVSFHFLAGASSGPCDLDEILGRAPFGSDFMLDFAFIFIRNKSIVRAAYTYELLFGKRGRNIPVVHAER